MVFAVGAAFAVGEDLVRSGVEGGGPGVRVSRRGGVEPEEGGEARGGAQHGEHRGSGSWVTCKAEGWRGVEEERLVRAGTLSCRPMTAGATRLYLN